MTRVFFAVSAVALLGMLLLVGCAKRACYSNAFGEYTLSEADAQYAELFQMKPSQYRQFLTFQDGWWKVDVMKMQEMGITVPDLCERYCRTVNIKVPFPVLIDYSLLRDNA